MLGYIANIVCVLWAVVETVFFTFPAGFPVTGGNMSMSLFLSNLHFDCVGLFWRVLMIRLCICCYRGDVHIGGWELVCACEGVLSWAEVGVVMIMCYDLCYCISETMFLTLKVEMSCPRFESTAFSVTTIHHNIQSVKDSMLIVELDDTVLKYGDIIRQL